MSNRAPSTSWSLRKDHVDYVRTNDEDGITIRVHGHFIVTDRATARLLAKRINECLDGTAKR